MDAKTLTIPDLLARFFATKHDHREYLRQAIKRDGYLYAANGFICARVPFIEGVACTESPNPKNLDELFSDNRRQEFMLEFPALPAGEPCKSCNGSGIGYPCPDCNGEGEFQHGRHTYDCHECACTGQIDDGDDSKQEDCFVCDGTRLTRGQKVQIGIQIFDLIFLTQIADLPGLKFSPHPTDKDRAGYFVWDGGEGLVMPMKY